MTSNFCARSIEKQSALPPEKYADFEVLVRNACVEPVHEGGENPRQIVDFRNQQIELPIRLLLSRWLAHPLIRFVSVTHAMDGGCRFLYGFKSPTRTRVPAGTVRVRATGTPDVHNESLPGSPPPDSDCRRVILMGSPDTYSMYLLRRNEILCSVICDFTLCSDFDERLI